MTGSAHSVLPEADYLARKLHCRVHVVEYPLAPECKLDESTTSVDAALRWVASQSIRYSVVAESAGGYFAVRSLLANRELAESCDALVMAYPFLDLSVSNAASAEFSTGYMLSSSLLRWFSDSAIPGRDRANDWYLRAGDLSSLPRTKVFVGEFDPLRDDWMVIRELNSRLSVSLQSGLMHGFMQMRGILPERSKILRSIASFVEQESVNKAGRV